MKFSMRVLEGDRKNAVSVIQTILKLIVEVAELIESNCTCE